MTVDYDPFSHQSMLDPTEYYRQMREEGAPHYIEKYDAWALTRFADVWEASCMKQDSVTFTGGQAPAQVLLDFMPKPTSKQFMTMDCPESTKWRGVIRKDYTPDGAKTQEDRIRELVREILEPFLAEGKMDVYGDYGNIVAGINAGYMLGMSRQMSENCRTLITNFLVREHGQINGELSELNINSIMELNSVITEYVAELRAHPEKAQGQIKAFIESDVDDGHGLNDEDLIAQISGLLITGSETTPVSLAGTLYYLDKNPDQKKEVLNDHSLITSAFLESARYDQPTNMLVRNAAKDIVIGGKNIKAGQGLLYIYASATRDPEEYENPEVFDIHRDHKRDLTFGHGLHKCLGMHLAVVMGRVMLEELLNAIGDYEVVEEECERLYGEFISGFGKVTIIWDPAKASLK